MEKEFLKHIPSFSSTNFWISKKGAIGATVIGFIIAGFLIELGLIPSVPVQPDKTIVQLWNFITITVLPVFFVLTWLILTQIYLRTGQGTKIGLAYDGFSIERKDWNRTRDTLRDLFKNGKIKNQVSLRFVPIKTTKIDQHAKHYMKRYGFTILVAIQESPQINKNNPKHGQHPFFPEISLTFTKSVEKQFFETTLKHTAQIVMQRTKKINTLSDVLEVRAYNLHDMILLLVAALCYREQKYGECVAISRHLEQSLSSMMRPDQSPRSQIRKLAMESYLAPTGFSLREIPAHDKLIEIRDFAENALDYFEDSYYVPLHLARIRFLTGDLEGAIELTEKYGQKIQEIIASGEQLAERILPTYHLNFGFLSFIQGHWVNSYNAYRKMLSFDAYRNENWEGIVEFIDYVETLEQYEGICYLQTLYRLIANKEVSAELHAAAHDWVNQDESRKELKTLLSRNYPSWPRKNNKAITQPKKESKKVKQRSKRRKKGRKKKRR